MLRNNAEISGMGLNKHGQHGNSLTITKWIACNILTITKWIACTEELKDQ
jgi:hypothetical protein